MPRVTNTTVYFKTKCGEFGTQMYRCAVYIPLCFLSFVHDQRYKWVCLQSLTVRVIQHACLRHLHVKVRVLFMTLRFLLVKTNKKFDWLSEWGKRAGLLSGKACSVRESILFDVAHSSALSNANRSNNDKPLLVSGRAELVLTTSITGE